MYSWQLLLFVISFAQVPKQEKLWVEVIASISMVKESKPLFFEGPSFQQYPIIAHDVNPQGKMR